MFAAQFISASARSLLVTDANQETLDEIEQRGLTEPVATQVADAYTLDGIGRKYSGLFAGLWVSHVPKQRLDEFMKAIHRRLLPGTTVVLLDNSIAQCDRLPITDSDEFGNTYQDRELDDGSIHRVLKNFPTQNELNKLTISLGLESRFMELDNFWLYQYIAV